MKLAIMQPYLFPYIGYFQLLAAVDTFVVYDDVNFIKQGWINRNNILINGKKQLITLELSGASSFKRINEVKVGGNREKLRKTLSQSYCRAPYFREAFPTIEAILGNGDENLATFVGSSLRTIADYLGLSARFVVSSQLEKDDSLKGQERVLQICEVLHAGIYINAIGGVELYCRDDFRAKEIDLLFLKTGDVRYRQFDHEFVPNLSIIDVLMFNSKSETRGLLELYDLV